VRYQRLGKGAGALQGLLGLQRLCAYARRVKALRGYG
jgi:hypothetical protein